MAGTTDFRLMPVIAPERTIIVTFRSNEQSIRSSYPQIPQENILVEPHNRGTATCIAFAMYTILRRDPDAVMVVVPSDMEPWDEESLGSLLAKTVEFVRENDVLMTIGMHPSCPDTNYGYIQGVTVPVTGVPVKVKTFTEKPPLKFAKIFVDSGEFLWNSGIFIWKAETIRAEYERYLPQTVSLFKGWEVALGSSSRDSFLEKAYVDCSKISVDYAIMEKTSRAWVYPAQM